MARQTSSRSGNWSVTSTTDPDRCSLDVSRRLARAGMMRTEPVNPYRPGRNGKPRLEPRLLEMPSFSSEAHMFGDYLQTHAGVINSIVSYIYSRAAKDRRSDRRLAKLDDRKALRRWLVEISRVAARMEDVGKNASACGTFNGMPDKLFWQIQSYFVFRMEAHSPKSGAVMLYVQDVVRQGANQGFLFSRSSVLARIHALHVTRQRP